MEKLIDNQKGYVISLVVFFVLIIMLSMAITMAFLIAARQKNVADTVKSTQSYYAAEAGIEDALLRIKKSPQMPPLSYSFNIGNAAVNVVIPNIVGGSRVVTSKGNNTGLIRNIETIYGIGGENVSFYYGVEVGEGGLIMGSGSRVMGNVFSGGNISGSGTIDNNAIVSGNGRSIQGVYVGGNVLAYSCLSPANVGNLTYVTGGSHTCTVRGDTSVQSEEISQQPLPIPQSQIDVWKSEAEAAEIITGNVNITNGESRTLGPVKITGSLTISNNATLTMTGTVYVVGNVNINNNAIVELDTSYSTLGGVLISNGQISISNNTNFYGSGQTGSYVMLLSTSASDSAIDINNNAAGAVFYTSAGGINISNNVSVMEATGYKVIMGNNSIIEYSSGIVNIYFSSGPSGSWEIKSWREW